MQWRLPSLLVASLALGACTAPGPLETPLAPPKPLDAAGCAALAAPIDATLMALPTRGALIDSATAIGPASLSVAERGPTPAATITPAAPAYCKVLGRIQPADPAAPPINFQVNLPLQWTGRSVQFGGGGFNGVLINALGLVPAARYEQPSPLAQGYVTVGTDSGHQNKPGEPPQAFALNDEALLNFAHASYKKVRDVSVALMQRAYGRKPNRMYFVGSSEGGREGLTMAQRYPADFDGIFSRVPVIHWTGLQHAGLRDGLALMGDGWIPPTKVKLVHDAVLAACDAADGLADGIVSDPVGCRARFDVSTLRCAGAEADNCLGEAQVRAVQTLNSPLTMPVELANGLRQYPGRGPSGEGTPANGPTGGWMAWWTGASAPALPAKPDNGIAWFYGGGAIQYFYARDPKADLRRYKPEDHVQRVREISAVMDSTDPDLSAFHARGGKLIVLENLGDYAQSPYAGIQYVDSVTKKLGAQRVHEFLRLFTAPGVDHVGTGGPANANFLGALESWVETDLAPDHLSLVEQDSKPPFAVRRSRPLCEWPATSRYKAGDPDQSRSFECAK
jgi:feruloyl esterase